MRSRKKCALKKEQEKADRLVISKSNLFDIGFFTCPLSPENQHDPIRSYISAYSSGLRPRKALPGFHPGIYEEHNDMNGRDPLAHYLDNGLPARTMDLRGYSSRIKTSLLRNP